MKTTDPIPQKLQGLLFGIVMYLVFPGAVIASASLGALSWSWGWLGLAVLVWYLQMVGVLVGYHRYFAHRSFETGRVMRSVFAFLGCLSGQKGPIFWASHHRFHHNHCEEDDDVHSPFKYGELKGWNKVRGFIWSHAMNLVENGPMPVDSRWVRDLLKMPEVVFFEKASTALYYALGLTMYLTLGLDGLIWGFVLPSFFSWNCVMLVNSFVHIWGSRPYLSPNAPKCNARNVWWLFLPMLGDNWHNNHHADMNSARAGFYWWQIDLNYCLIWTLGKLGLVYNIKQPDWERLKDYEEYVREQNSKREQERTEAQPRRVAELQN